MQSALVTVPLQPPAHSGWAGFLAEQFNVECRFSGCLAGQWLRSRRRNLPTCIRRTRRRRCIKPEQKQRDTRFLSSKGKAAMGGQVHFAHLSPTLDNHCPQSLALHGSDRRAQQCCRVGNGPENHLCRQAAQFRPTIGLDQPSLPYIAPRTQPEYGLTNPGHHGRHGHGEPGRRRRIPLFGSIDFMHPPIGHPAAQRCVERGNAARPVRATRYGSNNAVVR